MLYLGLNVIYELFAEIHDIRNGKNNLYVCGNSMEFNLVLVLAAFHHLYMDFVQPQGL